MTWDKDPEFSDITSLTSGRTSPMLRYSTYSPSVMYSPVSSLPPSSSSTYRRNSTIDLPIIRQSSTHDLPPYSSSSLRRSSTLDRPRDYSIPRSASIARNGETESRAKSPSYSRYTSTLEDPKDWGFSTLRRRNSRTGGRVKYPNDDIQF